MDALPDPSEKQQHHAAALRARAVKFRDRAAALNRDLRATVREAMTRAGAIGAPPAGAEDILRQAHRQPTGS